MFLFRVVCCFLFSFCLTFSTIYILQVYFVHLFQMLSTKLLSLPVKKHWNNTLAIILYRLVTKLIDLKTNDSFVWFSLGTRQMKVAFMLLLMIALS